MEEINYINDFSGEGLLRYLHQIDYIDDDTKLELSNQIKMDKVILMDYHSMDDPTRPKLNEPAKDALIRSDKFCVINVPRNSDGSEREGAFCVPSYQHKTFGINLRGPDTISGPAPAPAAAGEVGQEEVGEQPPSRSGWRRSLVNKFSGRSKHEGGGHSSRKKKSLRKNKSIRKKKSIRKNKSKRKGSKSKRKISKSKRKISKSKRSRK